jgi:hypothetical protein
MPAWPPALRTGSFEAMLNFEIADQPIYDGLELQWFDDVDHGTGMLALLIRRDNHMADYYYYYPQHGLRLDPAYYQIGAGTGVWVETDFADARLEVFDDGMHAAALFTDAAGRRIEVRVDDRDGRRRRRGGLLAPVSAAIEKPTSLIKYASPVVTIEVLPDPKPSAEVDDPVHQEGGLRTLTDGAPRRGRWSMSADGTRLTGWRWFAERRADGVRAGLDLTRTLATGNLADDYRRATRT